MKGIWFRLEQAVNKDDLFMRVVAFLLAVAVMVPAVLVLKNVLVDALALAPLLWRLFLLAIAGGLLMYGVLVLGRSFMLPSSKWYRLAERWCPAAGNNEGKVFAVLVLLPVLLLTMILRATGVSGHANE